MDKKMSMEKAFLKALKGIKKMLPTMLGVIMTIALIKAFVPMSQIAGLFTQNKYVDTAIGGLIGSILAGNSINSYIIGGEMMDGGISLYAITAFIVAWVTIGVVQIPAEIESLGVKFTATRNILSFILSIAVSLVTVSTLGMML